MFSDMTHCTFEISQKSRVGVRQCELSVSKKESKDCDGVSATNSFIPFPYFVCAICDCEYGIFVVAVVMSFTVSITCVLH